MENKLTILKTINFILAVVGIGIYVYLCVAFSSIDSSIILVRFIANIIAFVAGFVYLLKGYSKQASAYYKVFMWLVLVSQIVETSSIITANTTLFDAFKNTINIVLFTLLAGAKDYGKKNTYALAIAVIVFNVYAVIDVAIVAASFGTMAKMVVIDRLGQLVLAIVAGLMVCGKYADKTARGTK